MNNTKQLPPNSLYVMVSVIHITFEYNVLYLVGVRLDFVEQMTFLSNIQTVSVI